MAAEKIPNELKRKAPNPVTNADSDSGIAPWSKRYRRTGIFPWFKLPRELRDMVYNELWLSAGWLRVTHVESKTLAEAFYQTSTLVDRVRDHPEILDYPNRRQNLYRVRFENLWYETNASFLMVNKHMAAEGLAQFHNNPDHKWKLFHAHLPGLYRPVMPEILLEASSNQTMEMNISLHASHPKRYGYRGRLSVEESEGNWVRNLATSLQYNSNHMAVSQLKITLDCNDAGHIDFPSGIPYVNLSPIRALLVACPQLQKVQFRIPRADIGSTAIVALIGKLERLARVFLGPKIRGLGHRVHRYRKFRQLTSMETWYIFERA